MCSLKTIVLMCLVVHAISQEDGNQTTIDVNSQSTVSVENETVASSQSTVSLEKETDASSLFTVSVEKETDASSLSTVSLEKETDASSQSTVSSGQDSTTYSTTTTESDATTTSTVTEEIKARSVSTADPSNSPSSVSSSSETSSTEEGGKVTKPDIDTGEDIVFTSSGIDDQQTEGDTVVVDDNNSTIYDDDVTTLTTIPEDEETNRTLCSPNPCRNGGICIEDPDMASLFTCECPEGYAGMRCGTVDKCVASREDGQLCKDGACVYSKDGLQRYCHCFSGTYWDGEDQLCREPDLPCFPNPCMNGGKCFSEDDVLYCECPNYFQGKNCSVNNKCGECERGTCVLDSKRTTLYCKCDDALFWSEEEQTCRELVSACDSNPCHNGGTCHALEDEMEYNCTCSTGFSGQTCDVIDKCSSDEDCGRGACVLSDDKKSRICLCDQGFYLEEINHKCEKIMNLCQPNPCLNDGICTIITSISYNCTCSKGHLGPRCGIRDFCEMDGGNAYCSNGQCINNFELGVYYCTCQDDEYFQYSERKCAKLDLCPLMQCGSNEKCLNGNCMCKDNYKWSNATMRCESDFCSTKPCPDSSMNCEEGTGNLDYKCSCPMGYAFNGTHCNEATCAFPNLNACNQICTADEEMGYKCSCDDHFQLGENNHTCSYTGNYTCMNKTCDKGFCTEQNGLEVCLCPPGYVEVNGKCVDICSSSQLTSGLCPLDECEATDAGGFRCKCEGKYALSDDKTTCMVRNICHQNEAGWKTCTDRNAQCVLDWESSEGFKCKCASGQVSGEGGVCQDICSLESNQRHCAINGATCDVTSKGNMICRCLPFFKSNSVDGKCNQPPAFSYVVTFPLDKSAYHTVKRAQRSLDSSVDLRKVSQDITVTLREMFTDFTGANVLSCKLESEYILCKVEMQFATERKLDLKRLETEDVCLTNANSKTCLLPPALVLVKDRISSDVSIQPTNPCHEDIKVLACGSETTCTSSLSQKSFNCSCKPGFLARRKNYPFDNTRSFIEICTDIDECSEGSDPCPANSNCINTIGSYTCFCKSGFRAIDDAPGSHKCIEICYPNPCIHGECSRRGDHEFDCRCEAGYRGTFCNVQDEHFKRARINTIIVGVVLGGILLITIILFIACISRLHKKKYIENSGHMYYNSAEMVTPC